jgi:hypothetical protein
LQQLLTISENAPNCRKLTPSSGKQFKFQGPLMNKLCFLGGITAVTCAIGTYRFTTRKRHHLIKKQEENCSEEMIHFKPTHNQSKTHFNINKTNK